MTERRLIQWVQPIFWEEEVGNQSQVLLYECNVFLGIIFPRKGSIMRKVQLEWFPILASRLDFLLSDRAEVIFRVLP